MKKIILCSLTSFLAFTFIPNEAKATTCPVKTELPAVATKINLITRLDEIKTIDKSTLNNSEKKALRKEVRTIDKTLREVNGGIYISLGALLLIILILLLIF